MISEKINPLVRDEGPSGSVGRVAAPPATALSKLVMMRKIRGTILHKGGCFTINILISCAVMDLKHRRRWPVWDSVKMQKNPSLAASLRA
jgi:hypothetical protein